MAIIVFLMYIVQNLQKYTTILSSVMKKNIPFNLKSFKSVRHCTFHMFGNMYILIKSTIKFINTETFPIMFCLC
jgi:hypothetical protein